MHSTYPDEEMEEEQLSLARFVKICSEKLKDTESIDSFTCLLLLGHLDDEAAMELQKRIFINGHQGLQPLTPQHYKISQDYDAAIGICQDIPFLELFSVFPVAPFSQTLKKITIFMEEHTTCRQGLEIQAKLSEIPNVALGTVARRHIMRLMFPHLYGRNKQLPSNLLGIIYDKGVRPAALQVVPEYQSHWPASYSAAVAVARDHAGRLHFGTTDIPFHVLDEFSALLLQNLNSYPELKDAYFLHELKGTKGATIHDPTNHASRWAILDDILQLLDIPRITPEEWYINVAVEVSYPGHVLLWLEVAHGELLRHALPQQWAHSAGSIQKLWLSRDFKLDHVAQLNDFAGFRCTPRTRGPHDNVKYLNVYNTDKEPTYQLHRGIFTAHQALELIGAKSIGKVIADVDKISKVFGQCMGMEGTDEMDPHPPVEGCTRFEVRVQLCDAADSYIELPADLVERSIAAIPARVWWEFKFLRIAALQYVFRNFNDAEPGDHALSTSLLLGAVSIHMLNALNSRPAEGREVSEMLEVCCQHIPVESGATVQ